MKNLREDESVQRSSGRLNYLTLEEFAASGFPKDPTNNNIVVSVNPPDCIE